MSLEVSLLLIVAALALWYLRVSRMVWTIAGAVALVAWQLLGGGFPIVGWALFVPIALLLDLPTLRQRCVTGPLLAWFRKVLPPMSDTERAAIEAGTVWWDRELFSGRPDWEKLRAVPAPELTSEEQSFLDGPVETLCGMIDEWSVLEHNDLPAVVWSYIKAERFFGMIIPKVYGGLEFSAAAQSAVIVKICSRSLTAGVTVMVPNSLGPGELLMHYGTDAQKAHYLPRLAVGEEIPCFALTSPWAGSDAGSMPDRGIVCMGNHKGRDVLGLRVTWDKRYITLGPVATVLGLAFKAYDPDGLLGDERELGITCALIPTDTPGVEIGERHRPVGSAFQNGPTRGRDVFVPMDWIIGGRPMIGHGWRMLVECLAVGRAISLPALSVASAKLAVRTTGAYARLRRQFRLPIGEFEGVDEALARIGALTYRIDAARRLTASALVLGEKPSVLSAILKYHNTESMRQVLNDALDIHGGRGVCEGPSNYLTASFKSGPVSITVEGANILTRSMIIFGQGAIRCHPYLLAEMRAAAEPDADSARSQFDEALTAHVGFTLSNAARALVDGLTFGLFARTPRDAGPLSAYYRRVGRMSAAFAFVADVALLVLGGEMKRREKLSARLGDVLSHLYMASAVLKHYDDCGRPAADLPLARWGLEHSLYTAQTRLEEVLANFPLRWVAWLLRPLVFPLGRPYRLPDDRLGTKVARLVLHPSAARDRLTHGIYLSPDPEDPVGRLEHALEVVIAAEPVERRLWQEARLRFDYARPEETIEAGLQTGALDAREAQVLRDAARAMRRAIDVDAFAPDRAASARTGEPRPERTPVDV
jgi:acyl-CoA dehydrogenase